MTRPKSVAYRFAFALAMLTASGLPCAAQPSKIPSAVLWTRTFKDIPTLDRRASRKQWPKLIYDDDETLVLYRTIESSASGQSGNQSTYSADLQSFQADTGALKSHQIYPIAPEDHPRIAGTQNYPETFAYSVIGGVIVKTGQTIRFLTHDSGSILQEVPPPHLAPDDPATSWRYPANVDVAPSISGKTVVLQYDYGRYSILVEYNGKTFDLVQRWEIEASGHQQISITDTSFFVRREPALGRLDQAPLGAQLTTTLNRDYDSLPIDDHTWLSPDQMPLSAHERLIATTVSRDHGVVALQLRRVGRCCPSLDIDPPILGSRTIAFAYDDKRILLDQPSLNKEDRPYAMALSPSGKTLAILDGDELTTYKVDKPQ